MDDLNKQENLDSSDAPVPTEPDLTFEDLGLSEDLLHAIKKALPNISRPTPIQAKAIPLALAGKDIIGSARTGTGKTYAFCLPLISTLLDDDNRETQAIILTPTRELAAQIESVLQPLLRALHLPRPCLLIGGVSFGPQMAALRSRPRVIVATPGRLLDHMESGRLNPELVKVLVLDEADRMLDMGFLPQVRAVCKDLSPARQTFLFTATLPKEIRALAKEFMQNPESIFVDPPTSASQQVTQQKVSVGDDKKGALLDAVNAHDGSVLVFARTRRRTDHVARYLEEYGVRVESIHGDRSQHQRLRAIENFRSGRARVLVATDIAARGLDIPQVGLVINFDLPETKEDYVHRIGRTGRAGATGVAISFVAPNEERHWRYMSGEGRESDRQPRQHGRGRGPSGSSKFSGGKRFDGGKRFGGGKRPFERDERPHARERKPYQEREPREERLPREGRPLPRDDRGDSQEWRGFERREKRSFERRDFRKPFHDRKPPGEKRAWGEKRTFGDRKPRDFDRGFGGGKFGSKGYDDRRNPRGFERRSGDESERKERPRTNWRENFEKPNRLESPHPYDQQKRGFGGKPFRGRKPFGKSSNPKQRSGHRTHD